MCQGSSRAPFTCVCFEASVSWPGGDNAGVAHAQAKDMRPSPGAGAELDGGTSALAQSPRNSALGPLGCPRFRTVLQRWGWGGACGLRWGGGGASGPGPAAVGGPRAGSAGCLLSVSGVRPRARRGRAQPNFTTFSEHLLCAGDPPRGWAYSSEKTR